MKFLRPFSSLSADSRRVVVSYIYKRKYVQEVLVNRLLVKLAQEKSVVR